jgi:hypothetical protein
MGDHFFTATALDVAMPHLPDFLSALPAVLQALDEHPLGALVLLSLAAFYFIGRRPK